MNQKSVIFYEDLIGELSPKDECKEIKYIRFIGGIIRVMADYENNTGISMRSSLFSFGSNHSQLYRIREPLFSLIQHSQHNSFAIPYVEHNIQEIKSCLQAALQASDLHPKDNLPRIFAAITNKAKAAGITIWETDIEIAQPLMVTQAFDMTRR